MSELETVWSGDRGVYIGACLRAMEGYELIRPPKGAPFPNERDLPDPVREALKLRWESDLCLKIDAFVKANPGSSVSDIRMGVNHAKFRTVQEAVYRMVKRGHLRKVERKRGRGRPSPVYEAVKPCERPPKRRTAADLCDHIRETLKDGMTIHQIATAIGATRWQCRHALHRLVKAREVLYVQRFRAVAYFRVQKVTHG